MPNSSTNWLKRPTNGACPAWWPVTGGRTLLCLDEFGYVQLDARGSELLFQILAEREEKSSIALASNLPFR